MFRDIADNIPGYWWGTGTGTSPISGAFPHEITAGLRNLGYGDAWHRSFDFELALSNITHGRPILLQGDAQSLRHVWVADGYWEQIWLVERRFLGITINSWFEYADMIFMNWGWEGLHNGWVNPTIWRNENTGMPHFFTVNRLMWTNIYPTGTFQ
jgi:hypothetical protein